jgi:hypothetical protein
MFTLNSSPDPDPENRLYEINGGIIAKIFFGQRTKKKKKITNKFCVNGFPN